MLFRRISAALGVAGLLALPGTAAQASSATDSEPDLAPAVAVQVAPSVQDSAYLKAAHQVNLAEITLGRIAWSTTQNPELKDLAAALMRDHIRMDADLYTTARKLRVILPTAPTPAQQALVKSYESAAAATFDTYFISTQLTAHREALKLTSTQTSAGSESSVKALAAEAQPIIARHQDMLLAASKTDAGGRQS
ncbi:DUF4142 domain-containing protein [Actinoplanes regularis]|uniref:Putative membrane protein n=1 Tax=Actinoplanes regularis TaxID=52697 RepID=A0A239DCY5_9ACTN|nr:DUF4142 domain-containing protein [Actinoplanes regularis]GIE88756.1 hypothetical protein Are01nite_52360 [Actinoplanes regularis]SNS29848.1 putative membrane protein [Actinoplanes regularis]